MNKRKGFPAIAPELYGALDKLVERKFEFTGKMVRRAGYVSTEYVWTHPISKTHIKRDKFAIKAERVDGIKPFEASDRLYRAAGLKDNLRRF